jgi:biofilm PGA synthesis N-glycosyltransferase PgaC
LETISLLIAFVVLGMSYIIKPLAVLFVGLFGKKRSEVVNFETIKDIEGVSIIVPAHNEMDSIEATIESLLAQELPCPREIIVVENNSTDRTWQVLQGLARKYPELKPISYKTPKDQFPISAALNKAIEHCTMPYVFRIDADTLLKDPLAIQKSIEPVVNNRAVAVASNVRILNDKENLLTRFQSMEYFLSMEVDRRSQEIYNSVLCVSGAMQAFRLDTLIEIGGYNTAPQVPEDMEITWRLQQKGHVEMNHEAVGLTDAPTSIKVLFNQRVWWSKLGVICLIIHRKALFNKKRYGTFGLIGVPIKVFMSVRSLIGVILKVALCFDIADSIPLFISTYCFTTLLLILLTSLEMLIAAPVAYNKQGLKQMWLLPLFVVAYQPVLVVARIVSWYQAGKIILLDYTGKRKIEESAKTAMDNQIPA